MPPMRADPLRVMLGLAAGTWVCLAGGLGAQSGKDASADDQFHVDVHTLFLAKVVVSRPRSPRRPQAFVITMGTRYAPPGIRKD
jgi:hypothetical protein